MSSAIPPVGEELKQLKAFIPDLKRMLKDCNRDSLDGADRRKLHSIEKLLHSLKSNTSASLTWACVKMMLAQLTNESITDTPTLKKILSTFACQLSVLGIHEGHEVRREMFFFWKMLYSTGHFIGFVNFNSISPHYLSMYMDIIQKCFENLKNEAVCGFVSDILLQSGVSCLVTLASRDNSSAAFEVLDFILMQLLEPLCPTSQRMAKTLLNMCGWKITDAIKRMLNDVLLTGMYEGNFVSPMRIFQIIYELVMINKDLVIGLINNTELCFNPGRQDRIECLKFCCKLFGQQTTPGILNPVDFFSRLWSEFLRQENSINKPKELMILAKHTSSLLSQPSSHQGWCSLLFHLLKHVIGSECEEELVSGVIVALKNNPLLLNAEGPNSLSLLIKYLLTPGSDYELEAEGRIPLLNGLADVYGHIATVWVKNMKLGSFHDAASKILDCLLGTCHYLTPGIERWTKLRKIFVKKLVPYDDDDDDDDDGRHRMKKLLYLWINCPSNQRGILHELFGLSKRARIILKGMIKTLIDKKYTPEMKKKAIAQLLNNLNEILVHSDVSKEFLAQRLLPAVMNSPQMRLLLLRLSYSNKSCKDNYRTMREIKESLPTDGEKESEITNGLLYFLTELTCDQTSINCLVELVDSCVMGSDVSKSLGFHRLHVARCSLKLLNEILCMCPHLGLNATILKYLYTWSRLLNGSLSMLALQCLHTLTPYKLETYDPEFTKTKMLPLWIHLIESESIEQVKMAIRCVGVHLTSTRNEVLAQVLHIISSQLEDPSNQESFQRGVSASGYFSAFCPSTLKTNVRSLTHLLLKVVKDSVVKYQSQTSTSDSSSNNTWIDWRELPYNVSIKVQALRSIGRCIRFCGDLESAEYVLEGLSEVLSTSGQEMAHREVDIDLLRCEAASAILNICEVPEFQSKISKPLLLSLSRMMIDLRFEARLVFAGKLCRGLTPHKRISNTVGRSRGNLPPCMLGMLTLMGSDVWMQDSESRVEAERLCKEVFVSQHIAFRRQAVHKRVSFGELYGLQPHLVLENILAAAVPILAEHIVKVTEIISAENEDVSEVTSDSLIEAAQCLQFLSAMICHPDTYGGQVSKEYLREMVQVAKNTLIPITSPVELKKYASVLEVLELTIMHYNTKVKYLLTPPIHLPLPFYARHPEEQSNDYESQLSLTVQKNIEKLVFRAGRRKNVPGSTVNDEEEEEFEGFGNETNVVENDQTLLTDDEPSIESDKQIPDRDQPPKDLHQRNVSLDLNLIGGPNAQSTPDYAINRRTNLLEGRPHKKLRKF